MDECTGKISRDQPLPPLVAPQATAQICLWPARYGASRGFGQSGPPRSRATSSPCWGVTCITCTNTFAHPTIFSPPQEHGRMQLEAVGACAAGLHHDPCLSLAGTISKSALSFKSPPFEVYIEKTLPQHCKPTSDYRSEGGLQKPTSCAYNPVPGRPIQPYNITTSTIKTPVIPHYCRKHPLQTIATEDYHRHNFL